MSLHKAGTFNNYLRLIEEIPDYAVILMDNDGNIQDWNSGAETIKGFKKKEIIGKNFRIFYTPEDLKINKPEYLLNLAFKEGAARDEGWRVRKDGSRFWASVTITSLHNDEGRVIGYGKVTRDLTERKMAETKRENQAVLLKKKNKELKRSEVRFRHMMEEVQDYAIIILDDKGKVQDWNKGAERIKGYTSEEIIGKSFREFYTEEDRISGKPDRLLSMAVKEGRAHDEGYRQRKDGTKFWGSIVITAIHDDEGNIIGFSKVTRDLTERKSAEDIRKKYLRKLEQKNKELEQFAYIASHDLQEPLNTINSFLHFLQEDFKTELPTEAQEYVGFISEASQRMSDLVKDLLEYSKIGSHRKLEKVDGNELLREVQLDLTSKIDDSGAEITHEPLPELNAYATELRLLFQNLLSNSIKFRKKNIPPKIHVAAKKGDGKYKFTFTDNGIGIPKKYKEKIFKIFKRINAREEYKGTGIGLAHCRKIVELHKGKIWLDTEYENGTKFHFTIAEMEL